MKPTWAVLALLTQTTLAAAPPPATGRAVAAVASRPAATAAGWAVAPSGGWRWPLSGTPRPVRLFDPPPQPWLPGHRGVDLAADPGTPVLAASAGTVVYAGRLAGRGVVSVDHPGGLRTTYEPVDAVVKAGQQVAAGQPLGTLAPGHPGCPAAACLHWGLRRGREYLDPLAVLGLGRVRLLPTSAAVPAGPRRGARTRRRGCRSAR
ncbi:M23 family metallopeptidase [Catellatospora sp. NPDC049609]|uniref:murein hydrolase activator EnvC family protein n=1 Tax=Catellatospora sp. NPDC049609 TaxID=3155505 RepID=UPI00341D94F5